MVAAQKVSKVYRLYRRPTDRILELLPFATARHHSDFWALRDVSLTAERGEFVAVVGPNGSGKSTLLQILSGIVPPTSGSTLTEGRIAALMELGAGFDLEATGRENVYINGEILGLSRRDLDRAFPSIAAFAEIGEYIDRPVKEYSTGMYVRLAFSTAIHVEPDVLVIDEALAVGDAAFSNRCIHKFEELKRRQVTVVFVSHDLGLVKRLSDKAILLLQGQVAAEGAPHDVVNRYVGYVLEREKGCARSEDDGLSSSYRHGDGASQVREVVLLNQDGIPTNTVRSGERVTVRVRARFLKQVDAPVVGMLVRNKLGIDVFGTNTRLEQRDMGRVEPGQELEVLFRFDCLLTGQEYTLTVATQYWDGLSQDWLDDALIFKVVDSKGATGLLNLGTEVEWRKK